jgi:hypothetical protein
MTRKSRRDLWKEIEKMSTDGPTDLDIETEVVTYGEESDIPDDAEILETKSPVVTIWKEPATD